MEEKELAKMMLTAGITIGLAGAITDTPAGNTLAGLGLILIALATILFPRGLMEMFYEYLFGAGYEELLEEGKADDGKRRRKDL